MVIDKYGQYVYSEKDVCEAYLSNPYLLPKNILTSDNITIDDELEVENAPNFIRYIASEDLTVEQFDQISQSVFFMPEEYQNYDISKFVLEQCQSQAELQRAGEELLMYQERDMMDLLRYLKYLVDVMRKNNIVWGVGRGSSVSSFVLYLIGVHKINSLHFDLDIREFLK